MLDDGIGLQPNPRCGLFRLDAFPEADAQRINQTSQDAVLKHVNVNGSLGLEKNQSLEELSLKQQCRSAVGLLFSFDIIITFSAHELKLNRQRKDLPIRHMGREIFRFLLIVSIGCHIGGLMERQGTNT
jgi:hypothetical protein